MNNIPILGSSPVLNENQRSCVEHLRQALELAEEGKVDGLAIVLCLDNGWAANVAGSRPGDLNLGLDDLKGKILNAVLNSPKTQAVGRLMRARNV